MACHVAEIRFFQRKYLSMRFQLILKKCRKPHFAIQKLISNAKNQKLNKIVKKSLRWLPGIIFFFLTDLINSQ